MTQTRHGHHIAGTSDRDDDPNKGLSRCGGPGLCRPCSQEAQNALNKLQDEKEVSNGDIPSSLTMTAVLNGNEYPTAGFLIDQLAQVPRQAKVRIIGGSDPREKTPFWSLTLEWGGSTEVHDVRISGFAGRSSGDPGRIGDSIRRSTDSRVPSALTYGQFENPAQFGVD
jgi:hypothetical protein